MEKIKYYDNDPQSGIIYDYKKVTKEFKKLDIPKDVYDPAGIDFKHDTKYYMLLSERSRGKTTNVLLLGMIYNKMYGTQIMYIRQRDDMITRKNTIQLFDIILEYGYVEKLTDGKFSNIYYHARCWYYCNYDESGKVSEVADHPFMIMLAVQNHQLYKSSLVAPKGDFILYDEMISDVYMYDEFPHFCDLVKTIIRDRISPIIFLCSNMVDRESPWMRELMIYDEVLTMNTGDCRTVETKEKGTKIYIEILESIDRNKNPRRAKNIAYYFSFKNPKLIGITGGDWVIDAYRHIPHITHVRPMGTAYLEYMDSLIQLRIVESLDKDMTGVYIFCEPSDHELIESDVRFTLEPRRANDIYGLQGGVYIAEFIRKLFIAERVFYSDNTTSSQVKNYLKLTTHK